LAEVVAGDLLPIFAEIEAQRQAEEHPGTLYAVIPDDAEETVSVAFRSPVWPRAAITTPALRA
jgi:hypothetical protein